MAKSLRSIWLQYQRISDNWDKTKHDNMAWFKVFKIYSRYLVNIAAYNGVKIPAGSNYMPGVAARIAFPNDYWRLPCEYINNSNLFKVERDREYPRSIYAAFVQS